MKVLSYLFHRTWIQSHSYQSSITWETKTQQHGFFIQEQPFRFVEWSDCLSAFFCIVDNSEAFSYTVIKDEFSCPVEKTPQFSYDRLYFIMRWKDIIAGEKKKKIHGLCYSQKAVKYYMLQCRGSLWKECFRGVSDFPWPIYILRTNNSGEMVKPW